MNYKEICVLLVNGEDRQTLPLSEEFTKLGCRVATLNSSRFDNGYSSKYPKEKILKKEIKQNTGTFKQVLIDLAKTEKYDLFVATSDDTAEILAGLKETLRPFVRVALVNLELFNIAYDKNQTMRICMENDIPCPKTFFQIETIAELPLSKFKYPLVIKPRKSYGAIGYKKVSTEEELLKYCETIKEDLNQFVFQEYIPQTDIQYECAMFLDEKHDVKTSLVFSKNRWFPIDGGSSTFNMSVECPDIIESCTKLLKKINWEGAADIDIIHDPRDGKNKILEINPRVSGSVKVVFKSGVNIAEQMLQLAFGEEVRDYTQYKKGIRLRCIHTDILWFLKSPNRFKAKPSWFSLKPTYDQIWSWKDPIPFFTFSIQALGKYKREMKKRQR